ERSGRDKYHCNRYSVPYQEIYHRFLPIHPERDAGLSRSPGGRQLLGVSLGLLSANNRTVTSRSNAWRRVSRRAICSLAPITKSRKPRTASKRLQQWQERDPISF